MLRKLAEIINFVHSRMCRGTRYVHRVERTCTVAEWGVSNKQRRTGEERDFLQSTRKQQQLIFSLSDTISQHADAADKRPGRCYWSLITSSWLYSSADPFLPFLDTTKDFPTGNKTQWFKQREKGVEESRKKEGNFLHQIEIKFSLS